MIVVVDASAAVKLVLDENGSASVRAIWDAPLTLVAPTVLLPEVAAAIQAAARAGRMSTSAAQRARDSWQDTQSQLHLVNVDVALADRAAAVTRSEPVHGMDAIYLGLALRLAEQTTTGLLSFDHRQRRAIHAADRIALLPAAVPIRTPETSPTGVHHIELWMPDLPRVEDSLGWLLSRLGWLPYQRWSEGRSWRSGATYIVVEASKDLTAERHERTRPGLNHLALHGGRPDEVEALALEAVERGWSLLFPEQHPYAGGREHHAAYLENVDGMEIELVSSGAPGPDAGS